MKKFSILVSALLSAVLLAAEEAVPASRFGFDAADATECLVKALKSGAKKIRIDKQKSDWIIRPVNLRGDLELVIDPGVTVRAKKGEFHKKGDALFTLRDAQNVTISGGKGSRLLMNKTDYQNKELYCFSEWRHILELHGCTNVTIRDLILEASGGDGIYICGGKKITYSENIVLENLDSVSNHRQGFSIISCQKLRVRNCRFRDTDGTAPMSGIDFEPNRAWQRLVDCVVENCEMTGNTHYGLLCHFNRLNATTLPVSITVRNCYIADNKREAVSIRCCRGMARTKGEIRFENCKLKATAAGSVHINNLCEGFIVRFDHCSIDNSAGKNPAFRMATNLEDPRIGNLTLNDVTVTDPAGKEWCGLTSSGAKPAFQGEVLFNGKTVALDAWSKAQKITGFVPFTPAKLALEKLTAPAGAVKTVPEFKFRSKFHFLQYAKAGTKVEFTVKNHKVGPKPRTFKMTGYLPDGKEFKVQTVEPGNNKVQFTAPVSGFYRFRAENTSGAAVSIRSALPGNGFDATKLDLYRSPGGKLYFEVPAGAKEVVFRLRGEGREVVGVRIYDQQGTLIREMKDILRAKVFTQTRFFPERPEVWCLEFPRMVEDATLELGGDLNPVVSVSPELLPRAGK